MPKFEKRRKPKPVEAKILQTSAKVAHKKYQPYLQKMTKLDKGELRKLLGALIEEVPYITGVLEPVKIEKGDGVISYVSDCTSHSASCGWGYTAPCPGDAWHWPSGCTDEACGGGFSCAGTHTCASNSCNPNACSPGAFSCPVHDRGACPDEGTICIGDTPTEPTCLIDEPGESCLIDEPECIIDTPPTSCSEDADECIIHNEESPPEVMGLFASPVWQRVILNIASGNLKLNQVPKAVELNVSEDVFNDR